MIPPASELTRPDEMTLTMDQELRLLDDRGRRTRWFVAPEGSPAPGPRTESGALVEPWMHPWLQLNDPDADDMVGVCILDEQDASRGLLILVNPTPEAWTAWESAMQDGVPRALGCETGIDSAPPASDYRAVFGRCIALDPLSERSVRWRFTDGWGVISAAVSHPGPRPAIAP
jgi:hypothetical protein